MKITKTVTIKGTQFGFVVRNNNTEVAFTTNLPEAYKIARQFGKPIKTVNLF